MPILYMNVLRQAKYKICKGCWDDEIGNFLDAYKMIYPIYLQK